jgi:hypothetical protein
MLAMSAPIRSSSSRRSNGTIADRMLPCRRLIDQQPAQRTKPEDSRVASMRARDVVPAQAGTAAGLKKAEHPIVYQLAGSRGERYGFGVLGFWGSGVLGFAGSRAQSQQPSEESGGLGRATGDSPVSSRSGRPGSRSSGWPAEASRPPAGGRRRTISRYRHRPAWPRRTGMADRADVQGSRRSRSRDILAPRVHAPRHDHRPRRWRTAASRAGFHTSPQSTQRQ